MQELETILSRHERIALQVSGGRDSIACLYLLQPYWNRLTVYWLDTGSAYPETVSLMERIKAMVPSFVRVEGRQPQTIADWGMPTDILPASSTPMGVSASGHGVPMQDRYSCCLRSIMLPMHERMLADGITLIVRGQKTADRLKSPVRSGDVHDGIEYLFPIEEWSPRQVMQFLREKDAPIPRFYEMLNGAPDCMTCSAYWEEGAMAYLKRYHHAQYQQNLERLEQINRAVSGHIMSFNKEVAA